MSFSRIELNVPLRISFAGGGTDVNPYMRNFGGKVVSTTINKYINVQLENSAETSIRIVDNTNKIDLIIPAEARDEEIPDNLLCGWIKLIPKGVRSNIKVNISSPVNPGSGLGASSALAVAMTYVASHVSGSFSDWQQTATSAYELERLRLRIPGGCQDHYAAVFPGFNVFEFEDYNRARIIPLENKDFLKKLQENSTLVWTGVSRNSGEIIKAQISRSATGLNIDALNKQKELVDEFCAAFKIGDLHQTANVLTKSWKLKKEYAMSITNKELNEIYDVCIAMGAIGGKLLGAGGGGYFLFISKPSETETFRQRLMEQFQNIENIEMSKSWIHG